MKDCCEKDEIKFSNLKIAIFITVSVMVVEIGGGLFTRSLALLSDGFHMSVVYGLLNRKSRCY